jgi:hypothetical protein
MKCFVFIPADLEAGKVMNSLVYKPNVVAVRGNYDEVNRLCSEFADRNASWAFVNINVRPITAKAPRPSPTRSPSSWAGARRITLWCDRLRLAVGQDS